MSSITSIWGQINEEIPKYDLLKTTVEGFQVRKYAPQIKAVTDNSNITSSDGFGVLAGYIFGGNTKKESIDMTAYVQTNQKIAMTSPVITQQAEMAFVMPSKFTDIEQLPTPNDDKVKLVKIPEQTYIVATFTWFVTDAVVDQKVQELKAAIEGDSSLSIDTSRPHFVAQYNPPWTLPMLRTNEVAVPVVISG